jgi:dynactin complex subunit
MRYIKIEEGLPLPNNIIKNDIIELPNANTIHTKINSLTNSSSSSISSSKKISWNHSNDVKYFEENEIIDNDESLYILNKLKKTTNTTNTTNTNNIHQYLKQANIEKQDKEENNEKIIQLTEDNILLKEKMKHLEKELEVYKTDLENIKKKLNQ